MRRRAPLELRVEMNARGLIWLGHGWTESGETPHGWARGYAFVGENECLEDDEILAHLITNRSRLSEAVASMNGCFAAALDTEPYPLLITDRYGTIPIYLQQTSRSVLASDEPWSVIEALNEPPELDETGALDLLRTGYVTGTRTLIKGIETVAPATISEIRADALRETRYWKYGYQPKPMLQDEAEQRLAEILRRVACRTIENIETRGYRPVLTLSGGLDSRVLAATFAASAQHAVSAVTYGSTGDPEVEVAAEVASRLGLNHSVRLITRDYLNDEFIQRSVKEVGITTRFTCGIGARHLATDCADVMIPGHTGDFISGGHLPIQAGMVRNRDQLRHYLAFKHFRYPGSETALRRVLNLSYDAMKWDTLHATTLDFDFSLDLLGLIDRWNVENRQRRMILMELRAYEKLGRWMLPFYDHELVDFFAIIPHDLRLGQNLYIATANNRLLTEEAGGLSDVRRIGSRSMTVDSVLPGWVGRMQRLQPYSGWALQFGFVQLRDFVRFLRPKPNQKFGTDPIKTWFKSDEGVRDYLIQRVEAISLDLINAPALTELLLSDGAEDRVYNRLLPGAITIQSSMDQARETWLVAKKGRMGSTGQ